MERVLESRELGGEIVERPRILGGPVERSEGGGEVATEPIEGALVGMRRARSHSRPHGSIVPTVRPVHAPVVPNRIYTPRPMTGPKRTVLVVDDEPSLRLLCRVNLELEGHRVLEAATIHRAREVLADESVDVVLLDVHVGSDNGLDLLDDIEALELPVRVVMLSGTSEISAAIRARVAGVLGKPFGLEDLAAAVSDEAVR